MIGVVLRRRTQISQQIAMQHNGCNTATTFLHWTIASSLWSDLEIITLDSGTQLDVPKQKRLLALLPNKRYWAFTVKLVREIMRIIEDRRKERRERLEG